MPSFSYVLDRTAYIGMLLLSVTGWESGQVAMPMCLHILDNAALARGLVAHCVDVQAFARWNQIECVVLGSLMRLVV